MTTPNTQDTGERIAQALERIADVLDFYREKRIEAESAKRAKAQQPAAPRAKTKAELKREDAQAHEREILKMMPVGRENAKPPGLLFRDALSEHIGVKQNDFFKILLGLRAKGSVAYDEKAGYWRPCFDDGPPDLQPAGTPEPLSRHIDLDAGDEQSPFG